MLVIVEDNIPRDNTSFFDIPFVERGILTKSSQFSCVEMVRIGANEGSNEGAEEGQERELHLCIDLCGESCRSVEKDLYITGVTAVVAYR